MIELDMLQVELFLLGGVDPVNLLMRLFNAIRVLNLPLLVPYLIEHSVVDFLPLCHVDHREQILLCADARNVLAWVDKVERLHPLHLILLLKRHHEPKVEAPDHYHRERGNENHNLRYCVGLHLGERVGYLVSFSVFVIC